MQFDFLQRKKELASNMASFSTGFVSLNWNGIVQVIITLEKLLSQKQWDLQGS